MQAAVEVQGVSVNFGGVQALRGVSLRADRGQVHGLIGPNGAGKSTLIAVTCGRLRQNTGEVRLLGRRVDRWSPDRRSRHGVGATFQAPALFGTLTLGENLALARRARRRRQSAVPSDTADWLDSLPLQYGLGSWLATEVEAIPYPIRKLANVVQVLMSAPGVFITDEPAAGLSHEQRSELVELIKEGRRRLDLAVILVEHDVPLVFALADRVTVLDNGTVIASGPPDEVRAHPEVLRAYLGVQGAT